MQIREFYTDGGCIPNPGLGAWAYVEKLPNGEIGKQNSGYEFKTTNNRMEYKAVLKVLELVFDECGPSKIRIYSDSKLLLNTVTNWMYTWKSNGWSKGRKKASHNAEIKNLDLVKLLYNWCETHKQIEWKFVKGHSGVKFNEIADRMCYEQIRKARKAQKDENTHTPTRLRRMATGETRQIHSKPI